MNENSSSVVPDADPVDLSPSMIPLLFPTKKSKDLTDIKYKKFVKVLQGLNINIPFTDALREMPAYSRYLKEILSKKGLFLNL